jgi:Kef-type K+ transport system membrane component KefB
MSTQGQPRSLFSASRVRTLIAYAVMIALSVAAYLVIRHKGEDLALGGPAAAAAGAAAAPQHSSVLASVLLALAAITLLARFMGGLFRRFLHQPPVLGEILAGLMLGPSLLGAISPAAYELVLPAGSASYLGLISTVGVVLFMFLVGLDLDPKLLRGNTHATIAVSHASIVAPMLLGATLALWLYPRYASANVSFTVFSLFIGVSMSVTAFPVLARILIDRRVQRTRLGVTALTCAAVDDVTAWSMLAIVVGLASSTGSGGQWTIPLVLAYIAVMFFVVRPLIAPLVAWQQKKLNEPLSYTVLAVVFVALLLSAFVTEIIGIHALFGAFLLGAILPHDGRLAEQIRSRLEDIVVVLFLPTFFAFTGTRTQIGLIHGAQAWIACGAILLVATLGKFGGTLVAARLTGMSWRHSSALGILMNTRGLVELVVLNLGLDLGVISPTVFTMLVVMALATTFATTPVLDLILGKRGFADEPLQQSVPQGPSA